MAFGVWWVSVKGMALFHVTLVFSFSELSFLGYKDGINNAYLIELLETLSSWLVYVKH